ncbi:MAG TPA: ADP compounds hydrolase NudE [Chromatiaceae bacterium]|nr:ADP compounds hydrolase NudE [Chromatiaceae bacterium]
MSRKPPRIDTRNIVARSRIFNIEELHLTFSNDEQRVYERIFGTRNTSVLVVAVDTDDNFLLVSEYAAGSQRYETGFPKGILEPGENPLQASNRELREETGFSATHLEALMTLSVSPGYMDHHTHLVLATGLRPEPLDGDEPEPPELIRWPRRDIAGLLRQPTFTEARSVAALYLANDRLDCS